MALVTRTLSYVAVAVVAGGAGLLYGLLCAPVSGRETRRMIGRRLEDGRETLERKGRRAIEDVKDYVADKVDEARDTLTPAARH